MTLPSETKKVITLHDRHNPFLAPVVECSYVTKTGSSKEILHIICDLRNSDITYEAGSSFGILPENLDPYLTEVFIPLGEPYKNFIIHTKSGDIIAFEEFLRKHANLSRITSDFLRLVQKHKPQEILNELLDDKEKLHAFTKENNLATFLANFWHPSIPLQELADIIPPMMPRYYSIASSMKKVGEYAHFMVASFSYLDAGIEKESITASFFKQSKLGTPVRIFLQNNHNFHLPEDSKTPVIMIGPGTGLASLRGFLQEREATSAPGKNWLFTGDRQKAFDFHYSEELTQYAEAGFLKLSLAFSRDSAEKIYVQDLMLKEKSELWSWIKNEGASIYICGDAKAMAKDVQKALHQIAETEGNLSPEEAKSFFKELRHQKRLLLDIY